MRGALFALTFAVLGAALVPASAAAEATLKVDGDALVLTGDDGRDTLGVGPVENGEMVFDELWYLESLPTAGAGCRTTNPPGYDVPLVKCDVRGVTRFVVNTAGGNDEIGPAHRFAPYSGTPFALPSTVDLGEGNDGWSLSSPSDDELNGGPGNDQVGDPSGNDVVQLGEGDDSGGGHLAYGGPGDDNVSGDLVFGEEGNDRMSGVDLRGGPGDDTFGLMENPFDLARWQCTNDPGNDRMDGGPGQDRMCGGAGTDDMIGGDGADQISALDLLRDRSIDCGEGDDRVSVDRVDPAAVACERKTVNGPFEQYPRGGTGDPQCTDTFCPPFGYWPGLPKEAFDTWPEGYERPAFLRPSATPQPTRAAGISAATTPPPIRTLTPRGYLSLPTQCGRPLCVGRVVLKTGRSRIANRPFRARRKARVGIRLSRRELRRVKRLGNKAVRTYVVTRGRGKQRVIRGIYRLRVKPRR